MNIDKLDEISPGLGPFRRSELLRVFSRNGLAGLLSRGEITKVLPDLYARSEHAESTYVRARAASMWAPPGSAVTGLAALDAWGLHPAGDGPIGVVVPRGHHRTIAPWLRVTSQTLPFERGQMGEGLMVVKPELALIHAAQWHSADARSSLVYRACANGGVSPERALDLLQKLPRVRGRGRLVELLVHASEGIESFLEEHGATTVLTGAQFADVVRQHRVRIGQERFRLDAYHHPSRTAFEFDGDSSHSSRTAQREDKIRDALVATLGILTVRFGFVDVMSRPGWCRSVALEVLRARGHLGEISYVA